VITELFGLIWETGFSWLRIRVLAS